MAGALNVFVWRYAVFCSTKRTWVRNIIVNKSRCGMGETKQEGKKSVSANAGQAIPKRILLADDNKAIRDLVSRFLEFIGYEVALAVNGIEALAVFLGSSFDLVLTDLEMPAMDGLSLAGHIKEKSPRTPVILLTGADSETVLEKVKRGSIDSVIFKPFILEDLQSTVQGALASREIGNGSVGAGEASRRLSDDQKSLSGF
jgi:two-component system response regulator MprA